MPTSVTIDGLGEVQFPDTMSEADIASTIQSNLSKWTTPEPTFGQRAKEAAVATGRALVEPIRAIGQSVGYAGGITGALAKDVMAGNVLPSTRRVGILPNLENVGAFMRGREQPADETLTPIQQGVAAGVKMIPSLALTTLGQAAGIPANISFPALAGSETFAETGSPLAALTSAGIASVVPGLQKAGMEGAARVSSNLIKRFAERATGDVEEGVARMLANSRVAQKAIETAVGNATVQAYLSATQLPEFLQATPEKQQEMLATAATQLIGFSLLQLPYFKGSTLSRTQQLIQEDVPFVLNHVKLQDPEVIDKLARAALDPRNAQVFQEARRNLPPEGGIENAPEIRPQQESDLSQRERIGSQLQAEGENRNVAPIEPPSRPKAGSSDSLRQGGEVAQETPQAVAPVLAPISVPVEAKAPSSPVIEPLKGKKLNDAFQKRIDEVDPQVAADAWGEIGYDINDNGRVYMEDRDNKRLYLTGDQLADAKRQFLFLTEPKTAPPPEPPKPAPTSAPAQRKAPRKLAQAAEPQSAVSRLGAVPPLVPSGQGEKIPTAETPAAQAKSFDAKAAKEQKKYLLTEIDKAIETAPEAAPGMQTPELQADLVRVNLAHEGKPYGAEVTAWYEQRKQDFADLFQKYNIPEGWVGHPGFRNLEGNMQNAYEGGQHGFDSRIDLLKSEISAANRALMPRITIEVPGDGTFEIVNTKSALLDFKDRAKGFPTTSPKLQMPSQARIGPSGVPAIGDMSKENVLKAAKAFVTEDKTRFVLMNILSDGKQTVATNGRTLILIEKGIGGTPETPIHVDPETGKAVKDPGTYPNWTQVLPEKGKPIIADLDTARLLNLIRQAKAMTSEKSNSIVLTKNPDGSLAITSHEPSLGSYGHNVQGGGTFAIAVNPDYLADAVNAARLLGQEKVSIWGSPSTKERPNPPFEIRAKGMRAIIMPMRLSAATVPGAATVPTSNVPTLVDSQPLIDRALSEGGGDAALKALVPNVRIRYGPLPAGVPGQYEGGVITISKPVMDFIATRFPAEAQGYINKIIAEELTHAVADTVLTPADYIAIAEAMSEQDRQEMLTERPDVAAILNRTEQLRQLGGEYFAKRILSENEQSRPIDPNSTFGQRILAALQKIWNYLTAALKRFQGRNTVIEKALKEVRKAKADVLAGKTPVFEQGDALNAKAISDMLKSYPEMTAEEEAARLAGKTIERPTAAQAMGLATAGEVLAAHPLVRQAIAATQQAATIQPTTPEERHIRNVARGILANPIVSRHLAEPVAILDAAIEMTDGDLKTFEDVLRDPASTDEMKGAAAGNAKETLMAYDEAVAHFDTKYKTDRDALMEQLQKGAETEFDAAAARDVAGTLFKQFQELGQQIVNQTADQAARSALKQAEDHSATSMKVLNFLSKTGILGGLTHDDNRSIQDLMGYIQRYMLEHRAEFPEGTTPDTIVTENIGVGLDAIRDVLNIVRLSEPLRTAIAESKNLAAGEHYKAPLNKIKNKVLDAIAKGNLETAHNIYEKGIVEQGITAKESRDVVNFYAPKSAKILTAVRSMDGAKAIVDALQKDSALARQRKQVYDFLNIREITHSVGATSIKFKSTIEGEPDTAITWEGTPADYQANQKAARNLLGDYASYIAMADAGEPGYSPVKAAGLKQSAKELQDYTDPAVDPRHGILIPGGPARFTEYLGSIVNHPELVPKYLLPRLAGPLGDMVNKTAQAFSDVKERPANLATNLTGKRRLLLRAALESHANMRPWQYRKLVFNPTVASMQNFSDPGQLRVGDPIGNGQHVTKEDLAYIDHIRAFQNEVFATVNNYGKHRFAATARGFAGILFDGNGMVRFPYARGPRMLSRRFPPDLVSTIGPAWRAAATPEAKAKVIDSHLTDILLSYVRGVNASDYGRPYKYRLPFKQIIREFEEQPLTTFDDFVDRVTSLVNQDPDATAVTRDDVRDDLLGEINGFIEAGMKVAEDGAREDQKNPKVHITVIGGNNEMNSPREQAILPPGMYDYGIVSEDELASFLRDASISHGNAHLESAIAFLSELTRQIQDYKNQARNRNVPISTIRQESQEAMLKGQQRYSLQVAESLKEVLDAYVTRTENEIRDSANPWMKERPHQVITNPVMRAIITSIVSPLKPFFRNFVGGGQQIVILNKIMRNLSNPHALASGGKQMIQGALKELVFLGAKATHPGARRWRAFLEDPRGRAVVSGISKAFMDVVRERQGLRDLQLELGTTTNANILERLRGQWAFASTGGRVSYDEPGRARRVVNRLATMLNMYSEGLGATFLGYMDARLNGVGPYITQKVVQDMKATALAYGDKLAPDGLYPDEALSAGWGGWGASNQAAQLRQMWRTNGWGVLDRALSEYYNKVMAARAQEAQQNLPPGTLEDKVELLTPEQTNQMYVGIPEDINMPTRQSRTGYWKSHPVLKPFGWLLQWGTTWLQKLLGLTQVLNNQPFFKRHGAILPLMISVAILIAIMGTMQTEISSRVIGRMLEGKVTNFPTLFDAVTPQQAASAVLAATADSLPVYGDALNMLTGTGFKRGFDVNSTFLLMNLASDVMKTSKEMYQSGAIGRPMLQFASRYTYPFNQLSARFQSVSGLRDLTNSRNILTMGARGTSLETKARKPGGGGIGDQNYTPSTPLVNDWVNAIGNNDAEGAQRSYNALVEQKRRSGSLNPASAALAALRARSPIANVFGSRPDPADLDRVYANLPSDLAARARSTVNRFDAAIAALPRGGTTTTRTRTTGRSRLRASSGASFRLRRPKVRLRMPRLSPPRLRRLAA